MRSDSALDATSDTASAPVDTDSTMLLCAALSANSCDNTGIKGCTLYSNANAEKPPKNSARLLRLNSGLPAAMCGTLRHGAGVAGSAAALNDMVTISSEVRCLHLRIALNHCPIYI
ncbi:hypothetical protein RugamoR57_24000 [Duganella caerulea]